MCSQCNAERAAESWHGGMMDRRTFLRLGGMSAAGAVILGDAARAAVLSSSSLAAEFESAATEYSVPQELLLAVGYVNTLWEMPPPDASDYEEGDLHGRGAYGIMQLLQNPWRDTLGRAANLTGLSEEELKTSRAANVRGGAAVLADIQGQTKPADLDGWYEAVADYGDDDLYADEVFQTLKEGASATISTGEKLQLSPQEDVEVPPIYTPQARADYRRARWYGASNNYTDRNRGAKEIDRIVIHVAQGSYSGTISWFNKPHSNVSAHYVVSGKGKVAQCVRDEDVAWHAGDWGYNTRSIGIEHAGYGSQPRTARQYRSSARLSAYLTKRYNIPVDGGHIVPHSKIVSTKCPGRFDFDRYLRLIRHYR